MVALGVLGSLLLVMAQLACSIFEERRRTTVRQDVLEAAANVLEAARACPWQDLSPEWAGRQTLPGHLAERLPDGRLQVRVEPEPSRPHTRRVTVEVHWSQENGQPARPVQLVSLRSARRAPASGGKP
jgi:hypothetical protein